MMLKLRQGWLKINHRKYASTEKKLLLIEIAIAKSTVVINFGECDRCIGRSQPKMEF